MKQRITITLLGRNEYLKDPLELGLDENWKHKSGNFDERINSQGVYILYVSKPLRIIYVGKTRGPSMDFGKRLYRHATESGSGDSKVYQALRKAEQEMGCPILVSLITTEQIRTLFEGQQLQDEAITDIYEQVLIHLLKPEVQE